MKLGLQLGYWGAQPPDNHAELVAAAEDADFDAVFTAEAWGSDAYTPLAWWGSSTHRLRLGTSVVQLSARTPTACAMAALTLDHLSGGRHILGLGVSGPQVVEGWYGQSFPKPLARTREYVDIIRQVWAREKPVTSDGPHYPLPLTGDRATGLGKPLKPITHPLRADIPIMLGAEGPKNIALCAELCDGWLAMLFSPAVYDELYRPSLEEGWEREGARRSAADFEVCATVPLIVTDDVEGAADALRPFYALYFGGMGAKGANFHANVPIRMGYEREVDEIQELYLSGKKDEAGAKIPTALIEALSLIGPPEKIQDDLHKWRESVVTTLLISGDAATLRTAAELVLG